MECCGALWCLNRDRTGLQRKRDASGLTALKHTPPQHVENRSFPLFLQEKRAIILAMEISPREREFGCAGPRWVLRNTLAGCGTLPVYGSHPGTPFLFCMVLMGAAAGLQRGWVAGLIGGAVMLFVFGSMYLIGAHNRGRDSAAIERRCLSSTKDAALAPSPTPQG